MAVTKEQVLATAALCRLDLYISSDKTSAPESQINRMASQLDSIIAYMDILDQVDTENVEPLYSPMQDVAPPRPDTAERRRTPDEILANAPKRIQNFFVVPPVI